MQKKTGIEHNFDECFKTKCCSFFDNLYTPEGVKPDLKKVEASRQMQTPINKQQTPSYVL